MWLYVNSFRLCVCACVRAYLVETVMESFHEMELLAVPSRAR